MPKKKINWKILIISLVLSFLVAFIGSLFTAPNTDTEWYNSIRPAITPPNWVFPVVWNILFFLIALSLYFAWANAKNKKQTKFVLTAFITNFALNILWSIFYFGMKNPSLAFIEIIVLWISILLIVIFTFKISKTASYLMWPYLIWVGFASVLNYLSI